MFLHGMFLHGSAGQPATDKSATIKAVLDSLPPIRAQHLLRSIMFLCKSSAHMLATHFEDIGSLYAW